MSVTNGYVDVGVMREHYSDSNNVITQGIIERAIGASSRAIDRFCGRHFYLEVAPTTRVYRCEDPYELWVDDIGSTDGLVIKTDDRGDGTWATTWNVADFQLEPLNAGSDLQPYAWWRIAAIGGKAFPVHARRATVQVTAQHGWSAVPDDITEACILATAGLIDRKNTPNGIAGFGEFGSVRISRQDPDVIRLLHPYVKLGVGAI